MLKQMIGIGTVALTACGCLSERHPDSRDWEDVFDRSLSNAECPAGSWTYDSDGWLVPVTGDTILSTRDYRNFVLDTAYVMGPTANSGIFLYDTEHPRQKFEVQILDDWNPCYSNEAPYQLTGSLYGRVAAHPVNSLPPGQLNRMTVWCEGPRVRVVVNGKKVVDANLNDWQVPDINPDGTAYPSWHKGFPPLGRIPHHGRIGLQGLHGSDDAVRFKYLKVRELSSGS